MNKKSIVLMFMLVVVLIVLVLSLNGLFDPTTVLKVAYWSLAAIGAYILKLVFDWALK